MHVRGFDDEKEQRLGEMPPIAMFTGACRRRFALRGGGRAVDGWLGSDSRMGARQREAERAAVADFTFRPNATPVALRRCTWR